uniref:Uncharacterized protein n=1 Tax=Chromera velia CCMP2878 TaxID=1169474 RepID=A0A0G4GKS5_9ALVE|eukprot:Cvel_22357.t1-p1 / transcript=Cvel_22357.t1 / gene=Cvel_22357 / organism=Chromera_velia_CCMP2878 / gene_product=Vacuolar protein sorting-associated protein 53, putative / transcript_product=Vacuolar protein sorting-associated protein 53, putative / location=Cvel_scaffold2189:23458-28147(+) / protein_length=971 / sequence_SO=supercontig / SO=protein_coding / is_pseudo=false
MLEGSSHHTFSADFEKVLQQVIGSTDPFDDPAFDPVDYINKRFPTEQSLGQLDAFVMDLQGRAKQLDEEIYAAVREQAEAQKEAQADIEHVKAALRELLQRTLHMRARAADSEKLVQEICRDIRALDLGKRNLTATIKALKRLVMLVTALDQLRVHASEKEYTQAAQSIRAVEALSKHFKDLEHVPRVAEIVAQKTHLCTELQKQIFEDFDSLVEEIQPDPANLGLTPAQPVNRGDLQHAWEAIEALSNNAGGVREELSVRMALHLLEPYKRTFQPPEEQAGLEHADRRYAFLRKCIRDFSEHFGEYFPPHWRMAAVISEHFCHITRQHFVELLESQPTSDPDLLVRTLHRAKEFEDQLSRKYESANAEQQPAQGSDVPRVTGEGLQYPEEIEGGPGEEAGEKGNPNPLRRPASPQQQAAAAAAASVPRFIFRGLLTACFESSMHSWISHEERELSTRLSAALVNDQILGEPRSLGGGGGVRAAAAAAAANAEEGEEQVGEEGDEEEEDLPTLVYSSAAELFSAIRASLKKTAAISRDTTLHSMVQVFRKIIKRYTDTLRNRIPTVKKAGGAPLSEDAIKAACCVVGTAEYCDNTLQELQSAVEGSLEPETLRANASFDPEREAMWDLRTLAVQSLVAALETSLEGAFSRLRNGNWTATAEVGDHSLYVTEMAEVLTSGFASVAPLLSPPFFRFYCDRAAQAVAPRFMRSVYESKKVSESGAQQLLLDAYALKGALLEAPVAATGGAVPASYKRYVQKEMGRAAALLKVLTSNVENPEDVRTLLDSHAGSATPDEIKRLLLLKHAGGVGAEGLEVGGAAGSQAAATTVGGLSIGQVQSRMEALLAGAGANLNTMQTHLPSVGTRSTSEQVQQGGGVQGMPGSSSAGMGATAGRQSSGPSVMPGGGGGDGDLQDRERDARGRRFLENFQTLGDKVKESTTSGMQGMGRLFGNFSKRKEADRDRERDRQGPQG